MTEKEYYYNVELLELLDDLVKMLPNFSKCGSYFTSKIGDLRENLDEMFDGERKENNG